MYELFLDMGNIFGGMVLASSLLRTIPNIGEKLVAFSSKLRPYTFPIGVIAFIFGGLFFIRHFQKPMMFEISGLLVGLLLIGSRWKDVPFIGGGLSKGATILSKFQGIIGVIAILIGFYGLITPNS